MNVCISSEDFKCDQQKLNKSLVLIIKPVVLFFFYLILPLCIDVALTYQQGLICHFLFSEMAKLTFAMLKWYSHCLKGDIVFKPKFFVHACVHWTCVHGVCVFTYVCACTCVYTHVCGYMFVHAHI